MNDETVEQNIRRQTLRRLLEKDRTFESPHLTLFIAFLLI